MGEKKVALVTGAASGIGKATAERLQGDGYHVVFVDKRFDGLILQGNAMLVCDLTDERGITFLFEFVEQAWGRLDVLIVVAIVCVLATIHVLSQFLQNLPSNTAFVDHVAPPC